ncbi:allergen Tha p 1-like [Pararge aegeria]|nr:allergen Tha p 1-like [Pararge aegeria]
MKPIIFLCLCVISFVVAKPAEQYTDKFDSFDVKEIITNRRLLVAYIKCVLDQGKCSPEGKELKSHIREAVENYCAKCTPAQRGGTRTVIAHLINKEEDYWNQLTAKYDSDRKYTKKYETELRAAKQL